MASPRPCRPRSVLRAPRGIEEKTVMNRSPATGDDDVLDEAYAVVNNRRPHPRLRQDLFQLAVRRSFVGNANWESSQLILVGFLPVAPEAVVGQIARACSDAGDLKVRSRRRAR